MQENTQTYMQENTQTYMIHCKQAAQESQGTAFLSFFFPFSSIIILILFILLIVLFSVCVLLFLFARGGDRAREVKVQFN
jgi:hypothetical protein